MCKPEGRKRGVQNCGDGWYFFLPVTGIKVHLDPPPILVQSSQKLQDNGTKKSQNILFGKKLLIYEFFRFLGSFYFSALKYFENTPMAGITHGRS